MAEAVPSSKPWPIPEPAMYGPKFNMSAITPSTNLFFDDDYNNIGDVQTVANENGLNIVSTWCLPTRMTLYNDSGEMPPFNCAQQKDEYTTLKKNDTTFTEDFKQYLQPVQPAAIGTGITPMIIRQIIENEQQKKCTRLYFFDFDMLLSQFNGMNFPEKPEDATDEWFEQYAKYLFSDYIVAETESGRLNLLKRMFATIGPERIYIITANGYANKQYIAKSGRVMNPSPYLSIFVRLLQVLLPSFIQDHLVCTASMKKSQSISRLTPSSRGGARTKSRTKSRTKLRTKSRTKSRTKLRTKSRRGGGCCKHLFQSV